MCIVLHLNLINFICFFQNYLFCFHIFSTIFHILCFRFLIYSPLLIPFTFNAIMHATTRHIKLFYMLIQCIHHTSILQKQLTGHLTQAFRIKCQQLNDFVKPAVPGPKIKSEIDEINKSWVTNISSKLVEHYENSIAAILDNISKLSLDEPELIASMHAAIQQAQTHFGKKLQASTIQKFKTLFPNSTCSKHDTALNTSPKPTPTKQNITRKIKGHKDPLSNFYPCNIKFRGILFRSLEHAFHFHKALFHDYQHLAHQILHAPHAGIAKRLSYDIYVSPSWTRFRTKLMLDLLEIKFNACKIFRDTLMAIPKGTHLAHDVPDMFWGVGAHGGGSDMLGALLSQLYKRHTLPQPSQTTSSTPTKSNPSLSSVSPLPPSIPLTNRYSPLSDSSDWPSLPSRPSPKGPIFSATPLKRPRSPLSPLDPSPSVRAPKGKRTRNTSPKSSSLPIPIKPSYYRGMKKDWKLPTLTKSIAVIGSSNINRITSSTSRDIELHSFSGAQFTNFRTMFSQFSGTASSKSIILSLGLNDKTALSKTTINQLRSMLSNAVRKFPHSHIYIPVLNFPSSLPTGEQQNLREINKFLQSYTNPNVTILDQLHPSKFKTCQTDILHWTTDTANSMLRHWLSSLNS